MTTIVNTEHLKCITLDCLTTVSGPIKCDVSPNVNGKKIRINNLKINNKILG